MKQIALVMAGVLVAGAAGAGRLYKCTAANGEVTYAETQCAPDAAPLNVGGYRGSGVAAGGGASPNTAGVMAADPRAESTALAQRCLVLLKAGTSYKDPDSVRIEDVTPAGLDTMEYAGKRILAYKIFITVNAKNSFGGYEGAKIHVCYLSQNDKTVLRVD
jgi:hypothetical protein